VIQRFSVLANGDKESATGEIILNGEKNLFASDAMLGQANGIAGSQISFEHKADVKKNKHDANLRKIVPVVKPETGLAKSVAHFTNGGTPPAGRMLPNQDHNVELKRQMDQQKELATGGRDQAAIAQEALNKYNVKHATLLTLETWYAKEEADENDDQELIEEMNALIEAEGEARETAAAEMPDEDERVAAQLGYNTSVRSALATHATILPTDCGIMSQCISGEKQTMDEATHAVGVPADTLPAAGQAYHLTPKEPEDENNSWGSHHATVVMADGGDHVALEGAAHKATDNHLKVSLDDSWYFNMYGSEAGQSIANTYAADFPQGVDVTRTKRAPAA
jgi:hypothetical protein